MDGPKRDENGSRSLDTLSLRTPHRIYSIYIILSFLTDGLVEGEDLPSADSASCRIESGGRGR